MISLKSTFGKPLALPDISDCALSFQTSVPCERPDTFTSSANVLGFASSSKPLTNDVPNSETP